MLWVENAAAINTTISTTKTEICKGDAPAPIITMGALGGTPPYTFTYSINGGADQTISTPYTLKVDVTNAGNFKYTILSVKDATGLIESQNGKEVTIKVNELPTVDFTFPDNQCSGADVRFTSVITGASPYSYFWSFGDGATSTDVNPTHKFTSTGCATKTYDVKLIVTDKNGCIGSKTTPITINQQPDISFVDTKKPFDPFSNCSGASVLNSNYEIEVGNTSSSTCILDFHIDWGDGSSTSNAVFPASHTYTALGTYKMIITGKGNNGCTNTKEYVVKNVTNPSGGLISPGTTTDLCAPTGDLKFEIAKWAINSPGTTYSIDYGDNTPVVILTQEQLIGSIYYNSTDPNLSLNYPIPHSYKTSSCIKPGSQFTAVLTVTSACNSTQFTANNINVLIGPIADFTFPAKNCVNTSILFDNTTISGYNKNCTQESNFTWDFGDGTPKVYTNNSSPVDITHTYSLPGNYTVTLTVEGFCGKSEKIHQICIDPAPVPAFTLDKTEGCAPLTVNTANTTNEENVCGTTMAYEWKIASYTPGSCGTGESYTLTTSTGTSANNVSTLKNTTINFLNPGTYTLTLTASNSCNPVTSQPRTIVVTAPPTAVINPITSICQTFPSTIINPTAAVTNCGTSALIYEWSFPGGNPAASTSANPGNIAYSTAGNYTASLKVSNECGSVTTDKTFTINATPIINNTIPNQDKCAEQMSDAVIFSANVANSLFNWTNSNPSIGLAASGTGDIPSFQLKNSGNTLLTATITVTPSIGGCSGPAQSFNISVKPSTSFTSQPKSSSVCINGIPETLSVTYKNGTGTPKYEWYSNLVNNSSTGVLIPTATGDSYIPPTNAIGTIYYYCVLTLPDDYCGSITSDIASVIVNPLPIIESEPLNTQQICVGETISPLTVTSKGGAGTPTYQWYSNTINSNSGGTAIVGANAASFTPAAFNGVGNYYFYVIINYPASGCGTVTSQTAEVIVVSDPVITAQPIYTQSVCQNTNPAALSVTASGGSGAFSYQWFSNDVNSNVGGQVITTAITDTFIPPTDMVGIKYYYCVVSQKGLGCTVISNTSEVKVIPAPTFIAQPQSSTVCKGETPPLLSVAYKDGVGVPGYQWYSNSVNNNTTGSQIAGATNSTYSPSGATVGVVYYYCMVTLPSGGCNSLTSDVAKITVNEYPVISDYERHIASGTSFTVVPSPVMPTDIVPAGTTYTWTNPVIQPAVGISGATAQVIPQTSISQLLINNTKSVATATYTVTPESNGCVGKDFRIVVTVDPPVSTNSIVSDISCFGASDGSISASIEGGIPPYNILWTGPGGFTSAQPSIFGLASGDYNLMITDNAGVQFSSVYTIKEPLELVLVTDLNKNVSCFGAANGEISVSVSGGTPPYKYVWTKNNMAFDTIKNITNLSPGVYNVSITDSHDCGPKTASYAITEPKAIVISVTNQVNLKCFGDSIGSVSIQVDGGVPIEKMPGFFDYNYSWTGPNGFNSNAKDLFNLSAGIYTLEVSDSTGCSKKFSVTITQPEEIKIKVTQTPISCYGSNDATIKIEISGAVEPYKIEWSNLAKGTFLQNLGPGTYSVKVTDANACQMNRDIVITEAPFSIQPVVKNISCFGAQDGSISLNIQGGTPPISLVWDDSPVAGNTRNRLNPGTYTVRLSDASSCSFTKSFTIIEPLAINVAAKITNAFDCNEPNSGAIDLVVAGGTEPYKFEWSNGQATKNLSNIPAGIYLLNITDFNGCSFSKQFEIFRQLPLNVTVNVVPDYNCATKVLKNRCTPQVSGGVPPYKFTWSSGTVFGLNNEVMETTQSGIVVLGVTDANGCTADYTFQLNIPTVGIDYRSVNCNNHAFEFNALIPTGHANDYSFLWNFGDGKTEITQNPQHSFTKPGTYKVSLTLTGKTCASVFEKDIEVVAPPVLLLDKIPIFCPGDSILLHVSGADAYSWFNGSTADNIVIKKAGDYSVTGTNNSGCSAVLNFKATNFDLYNYTIQSDKDQVSTTDKDIQVWSESITYSEYFWDFDDGNSVSGNNLHHVYDITKDGYFEVKLKVRNPDGCLEYATKKIWITNNTLNNTITPNGDGYNDVFKKNWHIKVYNRNGILMYDGTDGWDGTYKGKYVSNDTYFYVMYYQTETGLKTSTGFVTVIR